MKSVATTLGMEMQLEEPTDSELSLYWIWGIDHVWKQVIQHHVVEIRNLLPSAYFEKLKGQFGLFLDKNGVWRCGGHLSKAEIPYGMKHPILLPK